MQILSLNSAGERSVREWVSRVASSVVNPDAVVADVNDMLSGNCYVEGSLVVNGVYELGYCDNKRNTAIYIVSASEVAIEEIDED